MDSDAQTPDDAHAMGASAALSFIVKNRMDKVPIRRWLTIYRGGSSVHVYVGPRGTVTKGPTALLGAHVDHLAQHRGPGHIAVYPKGYTPFGVDRHPTYQALRVADLPSPASADVAHRLDEALHQAFFVPWVRAERAMIALGVRDAMHQEEDTVVLHSDGTVDATILGHVHAALASVPAPYRTLWRAAQYQFNVIGRSPRTVPDIVEREVRAGTRGAFIANRRAAYVLVPNIRDAQDARSTALEEMAHGLDLLLGVVLGLDGEMTGRLPSETVARSNQRDFRALWEQRKNRTTIPRRSRSNERELFAFALVRSTMHPDTMKRDDSLLYQFVTRVEMEVAAYVGPP